MQREGEMSVPDGTLDPKPIPGEPNPPEIQHTSVLAASEQGYTPETLWE